jgi:pimeloyl-ACP methyl ester carboxylesterase
MNTSLEHTTVRTNGVALHVVLAGPKDGPPVILLHGFPEFWYGWRHQIDALAAAGLRLIIPDQRGYNLSDRPADAAAYNLDRLADDVIALADYAGAQRIRLVGHDWGGGAAWWTANKFPERVDRLAILNVPHHAAFGRVLKKNAEQRRKVLYMAFFRLPMIPERVCRLAGGRLLQAWAFGSNPVFTPEDRREYRRAWSQPGAMRGMLNWYRAVRQAPPSRLPTLRITVPTLVIWGKRDQAFVPEAAIESLSLCDDGRLEFIDDASHWVQHEAPERVNALLLDFLRLPVDK